MSDPRPTFPRGLFAAALCLCLLVSGLSAAPRPAQASPAAPTFTPTNWLYLPLVARDYDPSWQWQVASPAITPAPAVASDWLPTAAIDHDGRVHLFWGIDSWASVGKFIYQSTLTPAGWTAPTAILPTPGTSYHPFTPAIGPDGALHLVWLNKLTSDASPRLLYSVYRNGSWAAEEDAFAFPAQTYYQGGALQLDRWGQVYVIVQYSDWMATRTSQSKRTPTGWLAEWVPNTGIMDLNGWIFGDRDGAIRRLISRYENSEYHGYYSYWFDGAYLIKDALLPFAPHSAFGQLDAGSNLHVYWRAEVPIPGGQVMGLYHRCFDSAMAPIGGPELLTGQDATTATLLPAADESGRWTLAWQLATGEAKIGVWLGCQRQKVVSVPADKNTPWGPFQVLFSQTPNRWCGVWKVGNGGYRVRCADIVGP